MSTNIQLRLVYSPIKHQNPVKKASGLLGCVGSSGTWTRSEKFLYSKGKNGKYERGRNYTDEPLYRDEILYGTVSADPMPILTTTVQNSFNNKSEELTTDFPDQITQQHSQFFLHPRTRAPRSPIHNRNDWIDPQQYWKKKVDEYQQENFRLLRDNSAIREENLVLKCKVRKMEKKFSQLSEIAKLRPNSQSQNYEQLQNCYNTKIQKFLQKINDQQVLICRQCKQIKQLSKCKSQNQQLKHILDNMQLKYNEIENQQKEHSPQNQTKIIDINNKIGNQSLSSNNYYPVSTNTKLMRSPRRNKINSRNWQQNLMIQ